MNIGDRQDLTTKLFNECLDMAKSKGRDYSGDADTLSNFKRNAERLGLTKFQVWAVYFNKHIDAINNAIMSAPESPTTNSEPLHGRIVDAITYLGLLECLLQEDRALNAGAKTPTS